MAEKELWLAEFAREGGAGAGGKGQGGEKGQGGGGGKLSSQLEPFYAVDEAEAQRIVAEKIASSPWPLRLVALKRAPYGFRIRRAYLPGKMQEPEGSPPEGMEERLTVTSWIDEDFIYLFMSWFMRHGCKVQRQEDGLYRVTFPPGTRIEEGELAVTREPYATITLPDGAVAQEVRLLRADPPYNMLLIDPSE